VALQLQCDCNNFQINAMTQDYQFQQFIREHKGRLTPQRQWIAQEFFALSGGHYDVQELHEYLKSKGKIINPSTIFRTLKLLVQAGIAVERQFRKGNTKYELNVGHHDHIICLSCNSIVEFDSPKLERVQAQIIEGLGFEMAYHKHEIYGYCEACRRAQKSLGSRRGK
jgi:Fur family transcriptional regulator, ferric uptake regulator